MIDLIVGRRLVFESPLSGDEVTARLRRDIAPPTFNPFDKRTNLFEGTLVDNRFRMVRMVRGRNSARPVITGRVSSGTRGARIDVELRLHPVVVALCGIFLLAGGAVASGAVPEFLRSREPSVPLFFVLLLAWFFLLFVLMSAIEGRRATRMLARCFETEPTRRDTSSASARVT